MAWAITVPVGQVLFSERAGMKDDFERLYKQADYAKKAK
jgi:hypothetical protein